MPERRFGSYNASTAEPSAVAKERILLVDPDDDSRTMYREWFQQSGCEVVEAIDGREALTEALVRPPALVISEIRLPFIDGHALCEILRRDSATARIPILLVTSDGRTAALVRAKAAGASAVLVKPATPEQMLEESRRLLAVMAPPSAPEAETAAAPEAAPAQRSTRRMSKSLARISTTTPPLTPPRAVCPSCDRLLTYRHSHTGGVNERQPEQWDWYLCPGQCGMFEYRHRTRSLRRLVSERALG